MRFRIILGLLALFESSSSPNFAPPSGLAIEVVRLKHWSTVHGDLSVSIVSDGFHESLDIDVVMMENLLHDSELGLEFDGFKVLGTSCLSTPCRVRLNDVVEGNHTLQAINSDGQPCKTFRWAGALKKISDGQAPTLKFHLKNSASPPHNIDPLNRSPSEILVANPAALHEVSYTGPRKGLTPCLNDLPTKYALRRSFMRLTL
jgi:hypothetical protein